MPMRSAIPSLPTAKVLRVGLCLVELWREFLMLRPCDVVLHEYPRRRR